MISIAETKDAGAPQFVWPERGLSRVPDWVYTSEDIYRLEILRIFHGPTWNYVGLEAEIPEPGDFKRSFVGPTPVVLVRAEDGEICVVRNRCAHRGAEFCRSPVGNAKEFLCPYHQWRYDLRGRLKGVPFRRGIRKKGGMPKDFRLEEHGLGALKVASRHGVIFASFSDQTDPLDEYFGPEIVDAFDTVFEGRPIRPIAQCRQRIRCNWKLYHENIRDPYHATLLHVFLVTFGLLRADQLSAQIVGRDGRHAIMCSARGAERIGDAAGDMSSIREDLTLKDPRLLQYHKEDRSPWSVAVESIWPNCSVLRQSNVISLRHIVPQGPDTFDLLWTFVGYADDNDEMTRHRMRQGNLLGPAGLVNADDGEVMEFVQSGVDSSLDGQGVLEMDGDHLGTADHLVTEAAVRAMYANYRREMGL